MSKKMQAKTIQLTTLLQQGNWWKRGMLPKCLLPIKDRSC